MPDTPFDAGYISQSARSLLHQLAQQLGQRARPDNAPAGQSGGFGELLLQRQQALMPAPGGVQLQSPVPQQAPLIETTTRGEERPTPLLTPPSNTLWIARAAEGETVQGPDGITRNEFGHWERRKQNIRPFPWIPEDQLSADQREVVENWKTSPGALVWVYDVTPSKENNWAGWGPPPAGWTDRNEMPIVNGARAGKGLPWPPPGDPVANRLA